MRGHLAEDVVRRPVDDAPDPRDAVGGQVAGNRPEHRDAAADRGLEAKRGAGPPRDRLEGRAMMGDDVLVRRDHRLPSTERGRDERSRGFVAAHELHDDVCVRGRDEVRRRVGEEAFVDPCGPSAAEVPHGDADELEPGTTGGLEPFGDGVEGPDDLRPDGPATEHGHAESSASRGRPGHRCRANGRQGDA